MICINRLSQGIIRSHHKLFAQPNQTETFNIQAVSILMFAPFPASTLNPICTHTCYDFDLNLKFLDLLGTKVLDEGSEDTLAWKGLSQKRHANLLFLI